MTPPSEITAAVTNARAKLAAGTSDYFDAVVVALADERDAMAKHVVGFKEWSGPARGGVYALVDRLRGVYVNHGGERRFGTSPINLEAAEALETALIATERRAPR